LADPKPSGLAEALVAATLDPGPAALVESAMSLDDALVMGHAGPEALSGFRAQALAQASLLAGRPAGELLDLADPALPPALKIAFDGLATGLAARGGL
jgi:hypothetical protein